MNLYNSSWIWSARILSKTTNFTELAFSLHSCCWRVWLSLDINSAISEVISYINRVNLLSFEPFKDLILLPLYFVHLWFLSLLEKLLKYHHVIFTLNQAFRRLVHSSLALLAGDWDRQNWTIAFGFASDVRQFTLTFSLFDIESKSVYL